MCGGSGGGKRNPRRRKNMSMETWMVFSVHCVFSAVDVASSTYEQATHVCPCCRVAEMCAKLCVTGMVNQIFDSPTSRSRVFRLNRNSGLSERMWWRAARPRSRWRCIYFLSKFNGTSIDRTKSLLRVNYDNLFDFFPLRRVPHANTGWCYTGWQTESHEFSHWICAFIRMNLNAIVILIIFVDGKWLAHEILGICLRFVTTWWCQINNRRIAQLSSARCTAVMWMSHIYMSMPS